MKYFLLASLMLTAAPALAQEAAPAAPEAAPAPLNDAESLKWIQQLDDRQRNSGDYKTNVYIERKERNKNDVVFEAQVFRRDADDKLMILFQAPKAEKGKGYLRVDKNLWMYDPSTGKWERRTEREKIGGTDSRRADFDESRLAEEYAIQYNGPEKLGAMWTHKMTLTLKKGVDAAYAKLVLWLSTTSGNTLKKQEFADSGKLMRLSFMVDPLSFQDVRAPTGEPKADARKLISYAHNGMKITVTSIGPVADGWVKMAVEATSEESKAQAAELAPKIHGYEFKLSKNDSDMLEWGLKDFTAEPKS